MKPDIRREIDDRLSITQAQTPTGTTFQIRNLSKFSTGVLENIDHKLSRYFILDPRSTAI